MKTEGLWYKRFFWLASAATMFASLGGLSSAEESQNDPATRSTSGSREGDGEVPFTVRDGYLIVVEARIGGQRRMTFALDTGATYSVLRSDLAKGQEFVRRSVRIVNL